MVSQGANLGAPQFNVTAVNQNATTGALESYYQDVYTTSKGTAQVAEAGGDALITWGRWTNGSMVPGDPTAPNVVLTANQGMHFVLGAMTPKSYLESQTSGTASYSLLGATKPTYLDGATAPGTLTGNIGVTWRGTTSGAFIGVDLTVTMPDTTYRIVSAGGATNPEQYNIMTGNNAAFNGNVSMAGAPGRACAGGNCVVDINGFLAGATAQRAGLTYVVRSDGVTGARVNGAAVFARQ
jgi:hypothetical protein